MAHPAIHRPDMLSFPGPVYMKQLTAFAPNRGFNLYREKSAGADAPQFSGVDYGLPMVSGGCRDLKPMLDLLNDSGEDGVVIGYDAVTTTGTIAAYYRKGKNRGFREARADLVHDRFDMVNNGFFYWTEISAEQGQNNRAEMTWVLKALSNDGDNPFVHVGSAALVGTETLDSVFGLGRVKLNGSFIDSVQKITLANNFDADQDTGSDGYAYAMYSDLENWEPTLVVETNDASVMDDFEEPVAVSALLAWFRKLTKNGLPVADATAEHIKITGAAGTAVATEAQGSRARFTLMIALDKPDDATAPFTINTAAAIA